MRSSSTRRRGSPRWSAGFLERGEAFVVRSSGGMKQADLFNIEGHVALVTGAASGLGLAYAEVMAENGAKVVLADINAEGLEAVHARLKAGGCDVEPLTVDIGDDRGSAQRHRGHGRPAWPARHRVRECRGARGTGFLVNPRRQHRRRRPRDVRPWMAINFRANYLTIRFAATPDEEAEAWQHYRDELDRRNQVRSARLLRLCCGEGRDQQCCAPRRGGSRAL